MLATVINRKNLFDSFLRKLFVVVSLRRQKHTPSVKPVPIVFYTSFFSMEQEGAQHAKKRFVIIEFSYSIYFVGVSSFPQ